MNFGATYLSFGAIYLNFGAIYLNFCAKIENRVFSNGVWGGGWVGPSGPPEVSSSVSKKFFRLPLVHCCWRAHLRCRSFHYHNHLFLLLVVAL